MHNVSMRPCFPVKKEFFNFVKFMENMKFVLEKHGFKKDIFMEKSRNFVSVIYFFFNMYV